MTGSKVDARNDPITVGNVTVAPGRISRFELPVARLPTGSWLSLPVAVINGRHAGPHVWVSGAVHGDELNGVAIVRNVIRSLDARKLRGAVIAVPIVNVFGFINESRYLPDGRDLNRSFPGSKRGSLAARLAHLFLNEVVLQCDVGIDLHTAAGHRTNMPQLRGALSDPETARLAAAFGAPFAIEAKLRDGSLRQAATENGIKVLLYEAGQVQRFERDCVDLGVDGVLRTLTAMGMGEWDVTAPARAPLVLGRTAWVRSRGGGVVEIQVDLGDRVEAKQVLATIADSFGTTRRTVKAPAAGWVIARTLNPLVAQGDALVHLGYEDDTPGRDEPAVRRRRR